MATGPAKAIVVRPGEGHRVRGVEFLATSDDTPRFNMALVTISPRRDGPPLHTHAAEDDAFFVLEGELTFTADGEELVAGPGTFVLVPPGVEHTFANRRDERGAIRQRPRACRLRSPARRGLTPRGRPGQPGASATSKPPSSS